MLRRDFSAGYQGRFRVAEVARGYGAKLSLSQVTASPKS